MPASRAIVAFQLSKPLDGLSRDALDPLSLQASYLYGIDNSTWVYAHQIWAACTLYQATNKRAHWQTTEALYKRWIRTEEKSESGERQLEGIGALYFPVANYNNPVFFALLCMAQSAPIASGIATKSELRFDVGAGDRNASQNAYDLFLTQLPLPATRLDVVDQIWTNFVSPWINTTAATAATTYLTCATPLPPHRVSIAFLDGHTCWC